MTTLHESPLLNANAPRSCEERPLALNNLAEQWEIGELLELTERDATYVESLESQYNTARHPCGKVSIRSGLSLLYAMAGLSFWIPIWRTRFGERAAFGQRELAGLAISA